MRTRTAALVAVSTVTLSSIPALVGLGPTAAATPARRQGDGRRPRCRHPRHRRPRSRTPAGRRHGQPAREPLPDSGFHPAVGRGRRDADGRDVPGHRVGLLAAALGAVPGALRLLHLPAVTPGGDPSPARRRRPDRRTCSSTRATASSTAVRRRSRRLHHQAADHLADRLVQRNPRAGPQGPPDLAEGPAAGGQLGRAAATSASSSGSCRSSSARRRARTPRSRPR